MAQRYLRGTRVSLGTDGAIGCTPGWDHARCTLRVTNLCGPSFPRGVTRNADHQRGLGSRNGCGPGSLESGKRADVVVRSAGAAEAYPSNNPLHLLALTMGTGSVDTVLVNGEVVFSGGHSTRVDEQEVYRTVSDSVVARAGRLGVDLGLGWPVVS